MNMDRLVGAGDQQIQLSDIMLQCDTSLGATNLLLPKIPTMQEYKRKTGNELQPVQFYFKNTGSNNLIITAADLDLVNNQLSVVTGAFSNGYITIDSDHNWVLTVAYSNGTIGKYIVTTDIAPNPNPNPYPSIGSASSFAMIAGAALTINTTPFLLVTGSVAQLGAPTGNVVFNKGADYLTASPIGLQALNDSKALWTTLNALVPTYSSGGAVPALEGLVVGSNPAGTFNAGVYFINGALGSSASGIITLSGTGNFVFKVNGAISWGANSIFLLTGGASASNVFFITTAASGAITIAANCVIKGTYVTEYAIDALGAITVGDVCNVEGRLFAPNAAITYTAAGASESLYLPS